VVFFVASELGMSVETVLAMSVEELHGWVEWFTLRNKEEKKAMEAAKRKR